MVVLMNTRGRFLRRVWLSLLLLSLAACGRNSQVAGPPEPAEDPYRPAFHFSARSGWINDPNGLVYWDGWWHLGYQALWPRHWGHARSRDLVNWEELPIMLSPDAHGDMWSGTAAVDVDNSSGFFPDGSGLVAAYTAWGPPEATEKLQRVGIAYSRDGGDTWTKYENNPILEDKALRDFRDPKIFRHEGSGRWIVVVTVGNALRFYSSADLRTWRLESTFGEGLLNPDEEWECPDLFPMTVTENGARTTKWVLIASYVSQTNFANPRVFSPIGERYFVGDFDGRRFVADGPSENASFGDSYATITWSDVPAADGRRVAIGWMNHWGYANRLPTGDWQGAMTLPRELTLSREAGRGPWRLRQAPVRELQALRTREWRIDDRPLGPNAANPLADITADTAELVVELDLGSAAEVGVRVRQGEGKETVIGYRADTRQLFVDRARSGVTDFLDEFSQDLHAPLELEGGRLVLHVLVDRSSVEVFASDGAVYLSRLVLPSPAQTGMAIYATGGDARLVRATVHALAPATFQSRGGSARPPE